MSYTIEFHPALDDEIEALKLWYELQKSGLGNEFYNELFDRFTFIAASPLVFAIVEEDVRVARLKRFSYVVYFRVMNSRVRVLAVVHTSRMQGQWHIRR